MITMIAAAAIAAAQPAPMPAHGHDMPMNHEQHQAMKDKCCCHDMGEAGHDMHAPDGQPQERGGK
jgi:hypothetical protein